MNRNHRNHVATRNSTAIASAIGLEAMAIYAKQLAQAAKRQMAKLAIQRELLALDDRSLADIGINRAHIPHVAAKAAGAGEPVADFADVVRQAVVVPYQIWREKARATRELSQLTDRELMDIGLSRADIRTVVAEMSLANVAKPLAGAAKPAPMPESPKAKARAFQEVGVIRGDIEVLAEAVANRNRPKSVRPSAA